MDSGEVADALGAIEVARRKVAAISTDDDPTRMGLQQTQGLLTRAFSELTDANRRHIASAQSAGNPP